ncbi:isochorismatase family protein [Paraburkholderia strydomiana]|uniref:isochorismatase family protein n=1 Tax=Paraburkholderia strydomiana TaxID=1245417 RepID=UPI00286A2F50|nr:isochorismatase family protein [Paraburkholderia strydomiana]
MRRSGRCPAIELPDLPETFGYASSVTELASAYVNTASVSCGRQQHESDANGPLAHGSDAWQSPAGLVREQNDGTIFKTVGDSFQNTSLAEQLRRKDIDSVLLCGYASEFCVNATARRAELLALRTTVVSDLHRTHDKPHLAADKIVGHQNFVWANSSMSGRRVRVLPLADVLQTEFQSA